MVIGPGPLSEGTLDQALKGTGAQAAPGQPLDLLLFREDPDGSIAAQVRSLWHGPVDELGGADYLAQVDERVRDSISDFVAGLRENLVSIASAAGGPEWARRFGSLWWKTQISEKNSPGDGVWWQLFRAAALRLRLQERPYSLCAVIGDDQFVDLAEQVADQASVEFMSFPQGGERFRLHRVLMARAAGCLFLLVATVLAKWHHLRSGDSVSSRNTGDYQRPPLLYTWFPRVWTERFGGWKDMYYGDVLGHLADRMGGEPVLALRMYDRTQFLSPATYLKRLKVLNDPQRAPRRYVLLESLGRLGEIFRFYLNPWDALRYFRMTRHSDFDHAFLWEGLDVGGPFKRRIWRSVLVSWPHLLVLHNNAMRLARDQQPSVVLLYCFEYVYGRSIIEGTRDGAPNTPIIGIQHGPITPMKLLYAGAEVERSPTHSGGPPLPEPDIYAVDGPLAARILERRGIPEQHIRTTGPARFDDVWAEARRLLGLSLSTDRNRTRILVAPGLHDTPFVLGMTLKALSQDSRLELVLKSHPKVSLEAVSRWVSPQGDGGHHAGAKVTVVREGSIYEWMAQSDIFLATYSSTAVEALAFNLPVVLLIPNHTPDMSMFDGQNVPVLKASTAQELKEHVDSLVGDATFPQRYVSQISTVLSDAFGPTESHASLRLADLCAQLAAQPVKGRQPAKVR